MRYNPVLPPHDATKHIYYDSKGVVWAVDIPKGWQAISSGLVQVGDRLLQNGEAWGEPLKETDHQVGWSGAVVQCAIRRIK